MNNGRNSHLYVSLDLQFAAPHYDILYSAPPDLDSLIISRPRDPERTWLGSFRKQKSPAAAPFARHAEITNVTSLRSYPADTCMVLERSGLI